MDIKLYSSFSHDIPHLIQKFAKLSVLPTFSTKGLLDLVVISVKRGIPFVIAICGLEFSSLLQIAAVLQQLLKKATVERKVAAMTLSCARKVQCWYCNFNYYSLAREAH